MSEFYNEAIKNRYLSEIENEGSRATIKYIFIASKTTEEKLEMDLYNFSKDYIELVLSNFTFATYNTARSNVTYINNYISWCIKHGYRENNLNPLDTVDRKFISKFVDRTTKIHFSDEELEDLIEEFDNAQDQAMVQLWFEGVMGRDFSEIKNLHYYDIDWNNNEIEVKDYDGSKRRLKVSDKCMRYMKNAHYQKTFIFNSTNNGEFSSFEKPLMSTGLIFKNVDTHKTKEEGITTSVIYTRLKAIKDEFNLEYFTPVAIKQSGQIFMAAQIFLRDGKFGDNGTAEQWREIGERYKTSKVRSGDGTSYHNVSLMKAYITSENLKDFYGLDVSISIRGKKN